MKKLIFIIIFFPTFAWSQADDQIQLAADEVADGLDSEDYSQLQVSRLMETMNELHSSYRQILSLHFVEGFDYEEICQIMDISYANCRTMISRAKESLRKKLIIHHE